jgi:hypothetical protein
MVSDNRFIEYSDSDPASLAEALSRTVSRKGSGDYSKKASASVQNESWEDSGKKFVRIVEEQARGKN